MQNVFIHPLADVQSQNIGAGTRIWQFVVVLPHAVIGEGCNINCQVFIENDVQIGDRVTVKPGVQIWDGIKIEDDVFVGPNVTFVNDTYPRSKQYPEKFMPIHIGKGASIGANSTILGGITIKPFAMIGAGSVVTKDIEPYTLWLGNPAKQRGYITNKGLVLNMNLLHVESGKQFEWRDGSLLEKVEQLKD